MPNAFTLQLVLSNKLLTVQDFRRHISSLEYDDDYTFWIQEGLRRGDDTVKDMCSYMQHMSLEKGQAFLSQTN